MTFEEYVERSSIWVWDVIGYARSQSVRMGEDALTSMVVLGMRSWGVTGAHVFDVRGGEAKHGADVALWLQLNSTTWAAFAIQIKKASLRRGEGVYETIGHRVVGKRGVRGDRQIDVLVRHARRKRMMPLYAFLNDAAALRSCRGLGRTCCSTWVDGWAGCTVVHASVVKRALRTRGCRTVAWLHEPGRAEPARCALCRCGPVQMVQPNAAANLHRVLPAEVQGLLASIDGGAGNPSTWSEETATVDSVPGPAFVVVVPIDRDAG